MSAEKFVRWVLVLLIGSLVLWIRTLPLSLPAIDDLANDIVRQSVRERVAQQLEQQVPPGLTTVQVDDILIAQWIDKHKAQFEAEKIVVAQRLSAELHYKAQDGQEYVYLGDLDSYVWLRHARNYLQKGTTCDVIVNGECRDTYGTAPVGSRMIYNRSLHIVAIVALHKFITFFKPDYPLPASSFLVPVIIGVIGVLPAYLIGWRLAGNFGGLWAAILVSLNPVLLFRSMGSDNDVWNVVLPLYMMWAGIAALDATTPCRQAAHAVLAGVFAGLHAGTWEGWVFTYAVFTSALLSAVILQSIRYGIRRHTYRAWQAPEIRKTILVMTVFYLAAGLFTTLANAEKPYFTIPLRVLESVIGSLSRGSLTTTGEENYWPDALNTVSELLKPNLGFITESTGGTLFFFASLLGLLLLLIPKERWNGSHLVMLFCGIVFDVYVLTGSGGWRLVTLGLLTVPLTGALLLSLLDDEGWSETDRSIALVIIVWFLGALYLAYGGTRYLLLLGPPFGFAFAVTVGRLYQWLGNLMSWMSVRRQVAIDALLFVILTAGLIQPLQRGYDAARSYIPSMNDAWWNTLTKIREQSRPDAIVSTVFDYGYWVKYVAERRVSSDGGSLLTHVHYWFAKALVAPSERESVGVLRMLDCGSDATPLPEGRQGAYGKILATGRDAITAQEIVAALINRDESEAWAYLTEHGFTESEQADILRSTHCVPPEAYLIISTKEANKASVGLLGFWDFYKAYIAKRARFLPQAEAVADLSKRFGYTEQEAVRLYSEARSLTSESQVETFVAPPRRYLSPRWFPCRVERRSAEVVCTVGLRMEETGSVLRSFVYDPASPQDSRLHFHNPEGRPGTDRSVKETPAALILAGVQRMEEITVPSSISPDIGVLVDIPNQRILLGSPPMLRSMFTQLLYLDGRYTTHYEKIEERMTALGDRIVTWKINWNGR